jgi:predicted permease
LLGGREFTDRDDGDAPRVAVVNETMARRYWNRTDVAGQRIRIGTNPVEIVGVVPTGKYQTLGERPRPFFYVPVAQMYRPDMALHVRTNRDPAGLAAAVRAAVAELDATLPLFEVKTLRAHLGFATFTQRLGASLLGAFGVLALTLAAVGLYSVMAYAVSQRTRELGIRMALGARPADVRRMIVREGLVLLLVGLAVGLTLAFALMPFMTPVLVGVSGKDPLTFAAVALLLSAVALVASYIPARRAASVDPIAALRR